MIALAVITVIFALAIGLGSRYAWRARESRLHRRERKRIKGQRIVGTGRTIRLREKLPND